jgi:hypothetical protein
MKYFYSVLVLSGVHGLWGEIRRLQKKALLEEMPFSDTEENTAAAADERLKGTTTLQKYRMGP